MLPGEISPATLLENFQKMNLVQRGLYLTLLLETDDQTGTWTGKLENLAQNTQEVEDALRELENLGVAGRITLSGDSLRVVLDGYRAFSPKLTQGRKDLVVRIDLAKSLLKGKPVYEGQTETATKPAVKSTPVPQGDSISQLINLAMKLTHTSFLDERGRSIWSERAKTMLQSYSLEDLTPALTWAVNESKKWRDDLLGRDVPFLYMGKCVNSIVDDYRRDNFVQKRQHTQKSSLRLRAGERVNLDY